MKKALVIAAAALTVGLSLDVMSARSIAAQ